jgi:tetratricopeptide (TPR) repeat protein
LRSFLSRDPKRSAEEALLAGDRKRAMDAFAQSGDLQRAAQLAAELGDDEKLVRFSLMGALGRLPQGRLPGPLAAAELLASQGHSAEAILLFERAGSFQKAAEAALAASDPLRAASSFKLAGAWLPAVRCLEAAGKLREALQTAEEGIRVLSRAVGGTLASPGSAAELSLARADLLLQLGRDEAGLKLLRSMAPSVRIAEMLELRGQLAEAVDCYLDLGKVEEAMRLALRSSDRDRLRAKIFLRTGQPAEAGHLLAQLGLPREAAAAYESAKDWQRAAYRWEAAGEPRRAAEAYEKAGRLRDAARCYQSAGMPERATELTAGSTEATKTRQVRGGQTLQKARQHLAVGEKSQAASLLLQIQPGDPGFAEAAILLAPLLIEEGFGEDALSRLRLTPAGGTSQADSEREYWEGRSLEALGRREAAMACFERLIARNPGHREARERLDALRNPPPEPAMPAVPWTDAPSTAVPSTVAPPSDTVAVPIVGGLLAGRYEILAELGRGGMGQVFKARDVELDEIVAIKALLSPGQSPQEEMRLLREVQICRRITHPNVVRVYDIGKFQGGLFVTMEFIEGRGLDELIEQESPLPFDRIRFLLTEITSGLHEAHSQGIIHRDLKPGNIRVTATRLKILDFGIASMGGLGARLTHAGFVMGTPMYLAPDQILGGEPDSRSDLYSLGVLAYTMIAGREPYDTGDINLLLLKQIHATPPHIRTFRPETTDPWAQMLDRLMAKDPRLRYQSAQEVLNVLEKLPV